MAPVIVNGLFAAAVTGLTLAVLLLGVKALFFFADDGYRTRARRPIGVRPGRRRACTQRYLDLDGRGAELEAAGVMDVDTFTSFYWEQQFTTAGLILVVTTLGGLGGAAVRGDPSTACRAGSRRTLADGRLNRAVAVVRRRRRPG